MEICTSINFNLQNAFYARAISEDRNENPDVNSKCLLQYYTPNEIVTVNIIIIVICVIISDTQL